MNELELIRKAEVAEILVDAGRRLGESLEPERVYQIFHDVLAGVVPHDGIVVSSYDENDGLIRCEYAWVEGNLIDPNTLPPLPVNREGGGMQSRVIVSGEPIVFNDVADRVQRGKGVYYNVDREGTVQKIPESGPSGTRAAMMVPVKEEGRVVGVVQLMSDSEEYAREDLELLQGLVGQLAAAVRNARLQKEYRRLEAANAAAQAVAAEREEAARVLDAVGDAIFLVDADGVVRLWNRAAEDVTGLRSERVRAQKIADVFPEWAGISTQIPVADRGSMPRAVTVPAEVGRRDLWLSFVAVRSPEGIVYAFRDVTSDRRLEEEKSNFVATISHELRTPMAAIYGAAETLLRRNIDLAETRGRQLLEMIATQASRLKQITEEVLLTNQLDRGELAIEKRPVDLGEVARASVEATASHVDGAASVELDVAPNVPPAAGDRDRMQQVLLNLIDNAVRYAGGQVLVRVESVGQVVRVSVADRGPGIRRSDQERIFEKFYRADPQLTSAPAGSGLGLYISRELVTRMGGRLEVDSEPGAGATFVVELPQA